MKMSVPSASRLAALLLTLIIGLVVAASPASADFIQILELPNESGVALLVDALGATFASQTSQGAIENVTIIITGANGWTVADFHNTYNVLEPNGTEISDLLEVTGSSTSRSITAVFTSDSENGPPLLGFLHPTKTITETGAPQDVDTILAYAFDPTGTPHNLTLTIQSDVEAVPEPTAAFLLLTGCAALFGYACGRKTLKN